MKEALRGVERHEYAAILKAVGRLQNSNDVEDSVADGHMVIEFCAEELRGPLTENHIIGVLREGETISREPCGLADARIGGGYAKAGDDRVIGAGDNAKEHRIGMCHHRPTGDFLHRRSGNVAEEKVRDVALEDDDLAIARQDAGKHADGALENGDHGQHGRDAEGDARDTDERTDAVAAQVGHDQLEKDHGSSPTGITQAFPVTRTSSSSRSLRSFPRNDKPNLDCRSRWRVLSPR